MSLRTKKSFAWLWMAALFTATMGVSVQQIYCYCMGVTTVSLFVAEDACTAKEWAEVPDCCSKPTSRPATSCCKENDTCSAEHDGCMEKSTKVFQMKTEFLVDKPFDKSFDCPLWMEQMPLFKRFFRPVVCEAVHINKPPPPSPSGREICVRHQTFRC
ncbi:MAG: hypothetical protein KF734_14795 [Saprospiraceae bacterium]|nr:hypothetical protein [Saprospiraceae bacterium]